MSHILYNKRAEILLAMFNDDPEVKIHYRLSGKTNGPVVMLSHALGTRLELWDQLSSELQADYQVLTFDTRGHGLSSAPKGFYSLQQLAEDAIKLLDQLNIEKVHYVGISLSGMIGLTLATMAADRLLSLTLADTTSHVTESNKMFWTERIRTVQTQGIAATIDSTVERWFSPQFRSNSPTSIDWIKGMLLETSEPGYIGCCAAIRELDLTQPLNRIKTPSLVLVGEYDPGTPVADSEVICNQLSNAQLAVIPGAYHLSNIEAAGTFKQHVLHFLASSTTRI